MRIRSRHPIALALALALHPAAAVADETDKASCVEAHSEAQRLKNRGKLLAAREQLGTCATEQCPDLVAKDCTEWLAEIGSTIPSVVVRAVDAAGRETADVAVVVDGTRVAERLDGRALEVDPGEHTFVFETAKGARVEQKILVSEGERRRILEVRFPMAGPTAPPARLPEERPERGVPAAAWVFGGAAVIGLGVFTGFAISGRARQDELELCAPNCALPDVDVMRTRYFVADVGLVAGLVAGGVATWFAIK